MINDPHLRQCLLLVRSGVPFDVAFSLADADRDAWSIIVQELDGGRFNRDTWDWERG